MPNTKNFGYGTVLTAPSPASSGTSLVVNSGQGALFPSVSFNATVWPVGVQPTTANAEIVTVTNISTDTFTITRQAESSSARTIIVGDQIAATITAGLFPTGTIVGTTDTQTLTNKEVSGGVAESDVFGDMLTTQSITLPASRNFWVMGGFEISASHSVEIPVTTSLEIYSPPDILNPSKTLINNPYKFSAYRNGALTITTTGVTVTFDTELFDTNNNFDVTTGIYNVPTTGFYQISAGVQIAATASVTGLLVDINVNAVTKKRIGWDGDANAQANLGGNSVLLQLNQGDLLTIASQTVGANAAIATGESRVYVTGFLVSHI